MTDPKAPPNVCLCRRCGERFKSWEVALRHVDEKHPARAEARKHFELVHGRRPAKILEAIR